MSDTGMIKCDSCGAEVSKNDLPEVRYGGGGAVPANDVPIYRMSIRPITRPEHGVGGAHFDLCRKCVQRLTNGLEREPGDNLPPLPADFEEPSAPAKGFLSQQLGQYDKELRSIATLVGLDKFNLPREVTSAVRKKFYPAAGTGRTSSDSPDQSNSPKTNEPICPCGATEYLEGSSAVYCSDGHPMNPNYIGFGPMYGDATGRTSSLHPNISNKPKTKPLRQRLVDRVKDRIAKWTFPGV